MYIGKTIVEISEGGTSWVSLGPSCSLSVQRRNYVEPIYTMSGAKPTIAPPSDYEIELDVFYPSHNPAPVGETLNIIGNGPFYLRWGGSMNTWYQARCVLLDYITSTSNAVSINVPLIVKYQLRADHISAIGDKPVDKPKATKAKDTKIYLETPGGDIEITGDVHSIDMASEGGDYTAMAWKDYKAAVQGSFEVTIKGNADEAIESITAGIANVSGLTESVPDPKANKKSELQAKLREIKAELAELEEKTDKEQEETTRASLIEIEDKEHES